MYLACVILLLHFSPAVQAVPIVAVAAAATAPSHPANALPAAPVPNTPTADSTGSDANPAPEPLLAESNGPGAQNSQALETIHVTQFPPAKPAKVIRVEGVPSRRTWLLLSIADHSAATFDAYSTRAALSRGAIEADPLIRPFAGSAGLYAAIQVAPVALDFLARHMQRSQNSFLRRTWWLPQSASTGLFLFAGSHNLTVANH